jgi:hypothetical protein
VLGEDRARELEEHRNVKTKVIRGKKWNWRIIKQSEYIRNCPL